MRTRPHARCRIREGQLPLHDCGLAFKSRQNFFGNNFPGTFLPVTWDSHCAPGQRGYERAAAVSQLRDRALHLVDSASQQKIGRDQPCRLCRSDPIQFSVELGRQLRKPVTIGLSIVRCLDRMAGIQKAGNIEIGSDVLDYDIRRVAPTTDRHVSIGQSETFKRARIRGFDHGEAGLRARIERRPIHRAHLHKAPPQQVRQFRYALLRLVRQAMAQTGMVSGIERQLGRAFRREFERAPCNCVEQCDSVLRRGGGKACAGLCTTRKQQSRTACADQT